ncbi:MAG: DMT family transporter [Burkholderiales bacterium]
MDRFQSHIFISLTILLGLYGQLVLKWQANLAGPLPASWPDRAAFVARMLLNPWVVSSLVSAFVGMLSWMLALTKSDLSYAYPFTSLSFVLILAASWLFFDEAITPAKLAGLALIIAGIVLGSR